MPHGTSPVMAPAKRYIFIGGLHRSGTSLLHRMIASHPDVSGFSGTGSSEDEGQHLQTVYDPAYRYDMGIGKFAFHKEAYLDETSPLVTDANRHKLLAEWERFWDMHSPFRVEKSPPNLIRTRFLQAIFPESYFILIMRHPLATGYAVKKLRHDSDIVENIHHWELAYGRALQDMQHLRNALVIRYEDLVRSPGEILASIQRALGLSLHDACETVTPDINLHYLEQWESELESHPQLMLNADQLGNVARSCGYRFAPDYVIAPATPDALRHGCFATTGFTTTGP